MHCAALLFSPLLRNDGIPQSVAAYLMTRIRRLDILGAPVDEVTMEGALSAITERIRRGEHGGVVVAMNPEKVDFLHREPSARPFFHEATLVVPDGIGVVLAARMLFRARVERVAGADLMQQICARAELLGFSVYLYGATEEVSERAFKVLLKRHPALRIVGRSNGFVSGAAHDAMLAEMRRKKPDVVFVALGSPRQERWIADQRSELPVKIFMGIGGTLDTIAGTVRRAPKVFQQLGLEWFFRLLRQPSRALRQAALLRFTINIVGARLRLLRSTRSVN